MTPPKKTHTWLAVVVLSLAAFCCGVLFGVAGTLHYAAVNLPQFLEGPEKMPDQVTAHLRHQLGLSEGQCGKVREIFVQKRARMMEIRTQIQPQMDRLFEETSAEIEKELTPTQIEKWRDWSQTLRNRFRPQAPGTTPAQ